MLFSIIVPVYKVEKYLRQCIDSILAQSYSDFELILVDDGSPDGCPTICDEYAKKDGRITIVHKDNGGSTSARKAGFGIAQGDYIIPVDGDDYIECDLLKEISDVLKERNYDVICFGYCTFPSNIEIKPKYREGEYSKTEIENEIYQTLITGLNGDRFPPSIWGKAFKRELVLPIHDQLPNEIIIGEDSCISYPCIYLAETIYITHKILYNYRIDNRSLTRGVKKAFSWDEPLMRADFYLKYMPKEQFGEQIARITAHSFFNVAISVIKTKRYGEAKKEIGQKLSDVAIKQVLTEAKFKNNKKEQLALYCLKSKNTFLMKLIAKVV